MGNQHLFSNGKKGLSARKRFKRKYKDSKKWLAEEIKMQKLQEEFLKNKKD